MHNYCTMMRMVASGEAGDRQDELLRAAASAMPATPDQQDAAEKLIGELPAQQREGAQAACDLYCLGVAEVDPEHALEIVESASVQSEKSPAKSR